MADWVCYRLAARSPFHFGDRGVGLEETSVTLHSDTLFSALCLALRELGEDLDGLFAAFPGWKAGQLSQGAAPFLLSSALPYAGSVCFFPRPMVGIHGIREVKDPRLGKLVKKAGFVSQGIFERLIAGESLAGVLVENDKSQTSEATIRKEALIQGGRAWVTPQERQALAAYVEPQSGQVRLWTEEIQPHVAVDRRSSSSQVFAAGRVRFQEDAGLFFLVEYADDRWRLRLEQALRLLGESGIGGERSSGNGQFELSIEQDFSLAQPAMPAGSYTSLSLYWPTHPEVSAGVLDGAAYRLVERRGWLASPDAMNLRRKSVRMLQEGSFFTQRPGGALVDVKPQDTAYPRLHDVWRYGLGFPVACSPAQGEEGKDDG